MDYKPLFLYTDTVSRDNATILLLTVRSYEEATTVIEIARGRQSVFIDYFDGRKEYSNNISLKKAGEYAVDVKSYGKEGLIDEDVRYVRVAGVEKEYGYWILAIVIAVIAIASVIVFVFVR